MSITIREIKPSDAEITGRFIYEAFKEIGERHNFPIDVPAPEVGDMFAKMWIGHPKIFGVVAENENGEFVGSNFLIENDPIRGVGPVTVNPQMQSRGTGRKLMEAVVERGKDAAGIRLLQDAFNTKSMSLYASLGFEVKEPIALMTGKPDHQVSENITVRLMTENDLAECGELCRRIHGFERTGDVRDALQFFKPFVAVREDKIVAYATTISMWNLNHGVAETDGDMFDLLTAASEQLGEPAAFLLPVRQANFHRWALKSGLKMVKPMTLMAMGEYYELQGTWFPSVIY